MNEEMLVDMWEKQHPCPYRTIDGVKIFCEVRSYLREDCKNLKIEVCNDCLLKSHLDLIKHRIVEFEEKQNKR